VTTLRSDNQRLAQGDMARQEAEKRAAALSGAASQLATAQRELATSRSEINRLNETVQAVERDRTNRVTQLQQENAAISARLRQAQGTLDQIASAARLLNGGAGSASPLPPAVPVSTGASASAPGPVQPAPRVHTVAEGDTLTRISVRYFGTSSRWQEIYDANREVLKGENALRAGQRLRIP
jgi:nucleoid-associated protein YgaU